MAHDLQNILSHIEAYFNETPQEQIDAFFEEFQGYSPDDISLEEFQQAYCDAYSQIAELDNLTEIITTKAVF